MNRKAVALVLALLLLMAAALCGLPLLTYRMQARRMDKPVYVTASPAPEYDGEHGLDGL